MGRVPSPTLVQEARHARHVKNLRGGPGDFGSRIARAAAIEPSSATSGPIAFLSSVIDHQRGRAATAPIQSAAAEVGAASVANRLVDRFPLLDLEASVDTVVEEISTAVAALGRPLAPGALHDAGEDLAGRSVPGRQELVETWLDDSTLLDPRFAAWISIAAGPVLELAAASVPPLAKEEWSGPACPVCGGWPQVSVIREESGEFMAGSPRYLVCGRCASWWSFARATCPACGEDDSRKLGAFSPEGDRCVRIDACDTCRVYVKTFDLREPGARDIVPLVDDVATLTLDVWAHEKGLQRPGVSLAGV